MSISRLLPLFSKKIYNRNVIKISVSYKKGLWQLTGARCTFAFCISSHDILSTIIQCLKDLC